MYLEMMHTGKQGQNSVIWIASLKLVKVVFKSPSMNDVIWADGLYRLQC